MTSIFSKIISKEIPAYIVAEDDNYIAFLDVFPIKKGHTLVVPKLGVDNIFDLDANTYSGLMLFAQKVAKGLKSAVPCKKVGVAVIGLEVPHAHVHLIPMETVADMNFANPKLSFDKEVYQELAVSIGKYL
jgi:histidine triad (HIT) family protein